MTRRGLLMHRRGVLAAGFSPKSIAGLQAWYDASDAASFTFSSGTLVSQWDDISGNGRHLSQAVVARQPSRSGTMNGLDSVQFDGSDNLAGWPTGLSQPLTLCSVVKLDATAGNRQWFNGGHPNALQTICISSTWRLLCAATLTGGAADTAAHAFVHVANGASSEIRLDGAVNASGNAGTAGILGGSLVRVGSDQSSSVFYLGLISEQVVYSGVLGAGDIASLEAYFKAKWGTP